MNATSADGREFEGDAGRPIPDFNASSIKLTTVAPALGVPSQQSQPDYLDYDTKGRGIVTTMFGKKASILTSLYMYIADHTQLFQFSHYIFVFIFTTRCVYQMIRCLPR